MLLAARRLLVAALVVALGALWTASLADAQQRQQQQQPSTIDFSLRLLSVDASSAQFEIVEPATSNATVNYEISYVLTNKLRVGSRAEFISATRTLQMQTNSATLLAQQRQRQSAVAASSRKGADSSTSVADAEAAAAAAAADDVLLNVNDSPVGAASGSSQTGRPFTPPLASAAGARAAAADSTSSNSNSGERYSPDMADEIASKTYEQAHRFVVGDLESNRIYDVVFTVRARRAHLRLSNEAADNGVTTTRFNALETRATFRFHVQTWFDIGSAATAACKRANQQSVASAASGSSDDLTVDLTQQMIASCFEAGSNCTRCARTCYQVKLYGKTPAPPALLPLQTQRTPLLCEACPCDTTRSTGECVEYTDSDTITATASNNTVSSNDIYRPQLIRCRQCLPPYTGALCDECVNEGVDYYRDASGECVKCDCNGNSAYDQQQQPLLTSRLLQSSTRRCQAVSGVCIGCVFNTTGNRCQDCKSGYVMNAVSRRCVRKPETVSVADGSNGNDKNDDDDDDDEDASDATSSNDASGKLIGPSSAPSAGDTVTLPGRRHTLLLLVLYVTCVVVLVLLGYVCVKAKYRHAALLKNGPLDGSLCGNVLRSTHAAFDRLAEATRTQRARLAFHVHSVCPRTLVKYHHSSLHNGGGGGGSGSGDPCCDSAVPGGAGGGVYTAHRAADSCVAHCGLSSDDRLHLAEHQVYDDAAVLTDADLYRIDQFSDNDDVHSSSRNPYTSLTIKS